MKLLDNYREFVDALVHASKVVLTTHHGPDVDGLGCEIAMYRALKALGRQVRVINDHPYAQAYGFIDPQGVIEVWKGEHKAVIREASLVLALDVAEVHRIGTPVVDALNAGVPVLTIDHHPPGENALSGVIRPDFSSASELVYLILRELLWPIDRDSAFALYSGIIYDTRMFRFLRNQPRTLRVAAELIDLGADADKAQDHLFGSMPVDRLRLLARVVERLHLEEEGRLAWSYVKPEDLADLDVDSSDLRDMVAYLISLEGVYVALMFRPGSNGVTKVSLRSKPPYRVDRLAAQFGGGGHPPAAGCDLPGGILEVATKVVGAAKRMMEGSQGG